MRNLKRPAHQLKIIGWILLFVRGISDCRARIFCVFYILNQIFRSLSQLCTQSEKKPGCSYGDIEWKLNEHFSLRGNQVVCLFMYVDSWYSLFKLASLFERVTLCVGGNGVSENESVQN